MNKGFRDPRRPLKIPGKHLGITHNVTFVVRDAITGKAVSVHKGHNSATNSILTGIGYYLAGEGILNQGWHMLSQFIPRYISLGTMGLLNQEQDEFGLPTGIGVNEGTEEDRFVEYMTQCPGFGADGYDAYENNDRDQFGLGRPFATVNENGETVTIGAPINCELISPTFPRALISYREVVPETEAELPETIDVIFSAMISTGALAQFREEGKDYIFISEAGLWSERDWSNSGANGLLAGYRIAPTNQENWYMTEESIPDALARDYLIKHGVENPSSSQIDQIKPTIALENRQLLKSSILRVGINQVVQVIWKIQLGSIEQLGGIRTIYEEDECDKTMYWEIWGESEKAPPTWDDWDTPEVPPESDLDWGNWETGSTGNTPDDFIWEFWDGQSNTPPYWDDTSDPELPPDSDLTWYFTETGQGGEDSPIDWEDTQGGN